MELITFVLLAILIGMRHGMASDHVAAIADIAGSEERKRNPVSFGVMYAFELRRKLYFVLGSITGMYSLGLDVSMQAEFGKGGA
ncbi:hypothetical protein [Ectobacillus panaciterrae]|uniref:hypothetical protein n=1 Tax=Ectobacillus panaciterrae TaxID=363872 RepID=UPI0004182E94|nr:hypothetical protein [Ectobacillus panaciterrae]